MSFLWCKQTDGISEKNLASAHKGPIELGRLAIQDARDHKVYCSPVGTQPFMVPA